MKTLSIWIIAAVISYALTFWIKNLIWNLIIGTLIWYLAVHFINKWLEGEI